MPNKYVDIIPNPFTKLTKGQIALYYALLNFYQQYKSKQLLENDGGMVLKNRTIADFIVSSEAVVSRNIKKLQKLGYIDIEYRPSKEGLVRKILFRKVLIAQDEAKKACL